MKKFVYLILGSVLAAVALSCSRLPVDTLPEGLIAFRQEGFPLFNASVQTKATVVDESTLNTSGFNVSCTTGSTGSESSVWNNVAFSKSDSYFVAGGDGKWWPTTDPGYHFYGSNAALTFNADGCTVAATNATDVVCAYLPSPTYKSMNTLAFQHIFARITDVTFTAIDGYTISNISVTIVPNTGGTYNLRTGNGQTDGTGWSSLIEGSATTIANSTPGTKSNDLYLVPGSYRITASWTATKGAYSQTFSNKYCDIDVVGGKCNVITANLIGDASAIEFSVSVAAWGSNTIAIGNFPTEDPPPTFGGLMIAPAPLYYNGSAFIIKDDDWNHTSYNSKYGLTNGSYYFYGNQTRNVSGVSYGGYDDWHTPSRTEFESIISTSRTGSTINGVSGCCFALIQLTGVTHAYTSSPIGVLFAPDGVVFSGMSKTFNWNVKSTSGNTGVTLQQLNEYLGLGCAFLPETGCNNLGSTWYTGGGFYWSSNTSYGQEMYCLWIGESRLETSSQSYGSYYFSVRLVRNVE